MTQIEKRFSVALDIKRSVSNRAFEVVEGDNGNIIDVTLTDDGEAVDLAGCRVLAVFSKSNGVSSQDSGLENGGIAIDFNKVSIALSISSFAPGMVECELRVYSGERLNTLVTSAKFNFSCRKGIFDDSTAVSTGEYPLLMSLIAQCNQLIDDFEGLAAHASRHAADGPDPIRVGTEANKAVFTGAGGTLRAGMLPVEAGGTGAMSAAAARGNLGAAAAADVTVLQNGRLTSSRIVYVSPSGNDTTGDGSASAPYKTIQKAINTCPKFLNGYAYTVSVTAGTYDEMVYANDISGGEFSIIGQGLTTVINGSIIFARCPWAILANVKINATTAGIPALRVELASFLDIRGTVALDGKNKSVSAIVVIASTCIASESTLITATNSVNVFEMYLANMRCIATPTNCSNNSCAFVANASLAHTKSTAYGAATAITQMNGGRVFTGA